ncbi:DUF4397 domain-containing protein [Cellulomonas endophytica]|uniref:DUF4397 domain-containing protein n=1 Tax=Cellulomonas endophytica TaxID=2494735 RepID=UPI001011F678|nr:DUF4397 domain-containing protein [Cellulomonas endophytica]
MRTQILTGGALGLAAAVALAVPAGAAASDPADLYVLHAVPDTPVDVYVNGERQLDDFQPAALAGPLELPAGTYSVALTAADAADASAPILGPIDLTLAAGGSYTAVAHLAEAGTPTATLFTNDLSATAAGEGRLTVRHTAAAPAVDILAGGTPVVEDLTNPREAKLDLPAGTVSAAVALAGTTAPVIGPADVPVQDGTSTIVYAWGSADAGNLAVAVQSIGGLGSAPHSVDTGEAGLLDAGSSTAGWVAGGAAAALLLVAGGVARVRTARVQR